MEGYLGEFEVNANYTKYSGYTKIDYALEWMEDVEKDMGANVIFKAMKGAEKILRGSKVIVKEARWKNGYKEYRLYIGE